MGSWLKAPTPKRSRPIGEGLCAAAPVSQAPPEHAHVCVPFQCLPVSFPVKAFWLCVSVVPDSLGWVTCIRWAACQNSRDMASDRPCQASTLPVLSEAGKTSRQECHARGKAAEPGEGCGAVPAEHQLLTSSALPRRLLGSGGGCVCPRQVPGSGKPRHGHHCH